MAENTHVYCPLCGNKVPPEVKRCPICDTQIQEVITRRSVDEVISQRVLGKLDSEKVSRDYLFEKLPEAELPVTQVNCPSCGLELKGEEANCPRCGVPLGSAQVVLECPECGAFVAAGSKSCPSCGVGFEEEEEEHISPPPAVVEAPSEVPEAVELAHEAITSKRPEAAQPSYGLVNGRGAINGTGLVNGTGLINGTKGEMRPPSIAKRRVFLTRWQFLSVLVALVLVVSAFVYLSYVRESAGFNVDGNFDDWDDVDMFGMWVLSGDSGIDVLDWAIALEGERLYLYVATEGQLMASPEVDSLFLFVDADGSASTGYSVGSIGAEYLLQLNGYNGSVSAGVTKSFPSTAVRQDWNAWEELGGLASHLSGTRLEAMAVLPQTAGGDAKYLLMTQNELENKAVSYPMPSADGVLIIKQEPVPQVASTGLAPISNAVPFLRLTLTCEGASGTVDSVPLDVFVGGSISAGTGPFELRLGHPETVDVPIDSSGASAGDFVSAVVDSALLSSSFGDVVVIGHGARAYVESAPAGIVIDGAFADWSGRTQPDSDSLSVGNANIDIDEIGANSTSSSSFFYVSVLGEMCNGSYVPAIFGRPSGGGGGVVVPTVNTGEDFLRIFIDIDMSAATGYQVSISTKIIGAERMIEIVGLNGEIVSATLKSRIGSTWSTVGGDIIAVNDEQRIEVGIDSASIGGASSIDFIIETTDWRDRTDLGAFSPLGLRTLSGGLTALADIERWIVDGTTTSAAATAMSYQRKLFYDGTNYWSFYYSGADTVYKYSTDGGITWNYVGAAFKTGGVNEVSIWYDVANNIVYAVGDRGSASQNVYLQRGTVNPATQTITWAASDSTLQASNFSIAGKNTFICKDTSGYIWVLSTTQKQILPSRYDLSAFRSAAVDSFASFSWTGFMVAGNGNQDTLTGSILPAGTGSQVWAVYIYQGHVCDRKYTTSWSAEHRIFTAIAAAGNTGNAPPSAVVDANRVLHVVYGDEHEQPVGTSKPYIWYAYNNGAWSSPTRLDGVANNLGNKYPTISLDSSTGTVYAFWIETDSIAVARTIVGKKNVSGTWTSLSFGTQTTDQKGFLTSIYSAPGETHVCWQFTQNTTGTIHVIFDAIPEFSYVLIPVFLTLMLFAVHTRRSSNRRESDL